MEVDERLIQYRTFLDGRIKEAEDCEVSRPLDAEVLDRLEEAYTGARNKLYELFPELKP